MTRRYDCDESSFTDIVDRLWSKDDFIDVETGVNTAISKVREALHDSADAPTFIETVLGRGYRFIAAVEVIRASPHEPLRVMLAVLPFENIGSDPDREYLADGLTEETIATLGQIDPAQLSVIGRTSTWRTRAPESRLPRSGASCALTTSWRGQFGARAACCGSPPS